MFYFKFILFYFIYILFYLYFILSVFYFIHILFYFILFYFILSISEVQKAWNLSFPTPECLLAWSQQKFYFHSNKISLSLK